MLAGENAAAAEAGAGGSEDAHGWARIEEEHWAAGLLDAPACGLSGTWPG